MRLSRIGENGFAVFVCKFAGTKGCFCDKPNVCNDVHAPSSGFPNVGHAGLSQNPARRRVRVRYAFTDI